MFSLKFSHKQRGFKIRINYVESEAVSVHSGQKS